jgi:uncharacterized protein DUF6338
LVFAYCARWPSGFLAIVYLIAFGPALTRAVTQPVSSLGHPRLLGVALAVLIFVVPCVSAVSFHAYHTLQAYGRVKFWIKLRTYDPTPTAWDFAFGNAEPGFVRVLTKEGRWVGGYAGPKSFFSSYPEDRELFLEQAWQLSDEGVFDTVIDGSAGVWIDCAHAQLVRFLEEKPPTASSMDNGQKETDGEGSSG